MADPKYSSSDVPDFSTYPGSQPELPELPEHGSPANYGYARRAQYRHYDRGPSALDESARKLGWALGRIIGTLEQIRDRAGERFQDARLEVQEQMTEVPEEARRSLENARVKAQKSLSNLRYNAVRMRHRAVRDYPIQVILAAGALGILAGAGLRMWRENRG
jgi:ElaB/YqjD/DUF883 family membrane-anchored ribosome-binding protein